MLPISRIVLKFLFRSFEIVPPDCTVIPTVAEDPANVTLPIAGNHYHHHSHRQLSAQEQFEHLRQHFAEYRTASYWRTNAFLLLHTLVYVLVIYSGVQLAGLVLHDDPWAVIKGLGLSALIFMLSLGVFFGNWFGYLMIVVQDRFKEGRVIGMGNTIGMIVHMDSQAVTLLLLPPETAAGILSNINNTATAPAAVVVAASKTLRPGQQTNLTIPHKGLIKQHIPPIRLFQSDVFDYGMIYDY